MAAADELVVVEAKEARERHEVGMEYDLHGVVGRVEEVSVPEVFKYRVVCVVPHVVRDDRWPLRGLAREDRSLKAQL